MFILIVEGIKLRQSQIGSLTHSPLSVRKSMINESQVVTAHAVSRGIVDADVSVGVSDFLASSEVKHPTGYGRENGVLRPPSVADVWRVRQVIKPYLNKTELIRSNTLSERLSTNVYLKLEMMQKTGSFKVRGAFAKLLSLSPQEREGGVVAVSGGNHAQAVAYVAQKLSIRALILMPEDTPRNYVEATRDYGSGVVFVRSLKEAFAELIALCTCIDTVTYAIH